MSGNEGGPIKVFSSIGEKHRHYAEKRGHVVLNAGPTQALIDIDSAEDLAIFNHRWVAFHQAAPSATWEKKPSPSGKFGHWHVFVEMGREIGQLERLWIQAILGDDPRRGLCAYHDYVTYSGAEEISILFQLPENKTEINAEESC